MGGGGVPCASPKFLFRQLFGQGYMQVHFNLENILDIQLHMIDTLSYHYMNLFLSWSSWIQGPISDVQRPTFSQRQNAASNITSFLLALHQQTPLSVPFIKQSLLYLRIKCSIQRPHYLQRKKGFMNTDMAFNEMFQYSLALGLMDGVADKGLPISEFLKHGDHGLGTFRLMNGEMIVIDGKAYQMLADGSIVDLDPTGDAVHPFAQITRFKPDIIAQVAVPSKEELNDIVSGLL